DHRGRLVLLDELSGGLLARSVAEREVDRHGTGSALLEQVLVIDGEAGRLGRLDDGGHVALLADEDRLAAEAEREGASKRCGAGRAVGFARRQTRRRASPGNDEDVLARLDRVLQ